MANNERFSSHEAERGESKNQWSQRHTMIPRACQGQASLTSCPLAELCVWWPTRVARRCVAPPLGRIRLEQSVVAKSVSLKILDASIIPERQSPSSNSLESP